jgi:hypothetical protein
MPSGSRAKQARRQARKSVVAKKGWPWGTITVVIAILALAGLVFGYASAKISERTEWLPSASNNDPSDKISGVVKKEYKSAQHVKADQRVAYDQSPPFGGAHDGEWAACMGTVYDKAVRTENMVHSMEHGAVWIAYEPSQVSGDALGKLRSRVDGQEFTLLSSYPGLDSPISLQSWGHQLKVSDAGDPRIDQFIQSLRRNEYMYPEPGATCDNNDFDTADPPPFVAEKPGPGAVPVEGAPQSTPASDAPKPTAEQ